MSLEAFYQQPLDEEIIRRDDRGGLREKFKLFVAVTNTQLVREFHQSISQKYPSGKKTNPYDRIKHWEAKVVLLHTLLSDSPIFVKGHFDLSKIYTSPDLNEFINTCLELGLYIEGQFGIHIRKDAEKKAAQVFHKFLEMLGISTIKSTKKIGKDKIYKYMINPDSYNTMVELRTLRESIQDDWLFINQLHGFTPPQSHH
jgi:hypothetical protein